MRRFQARRTTRSVLRLYGHYQDNRYGLEMLRDDIVRNLQNARRFIKNPVARQDVVDAERLTRILCRRAQYLRAALGRAKAGSERKRRRPRSGRLRVLQGGVR